MKEILHVQNFGPIKDVKIEVKDINIFIGTTSSGKSTIAKLIAIFRSGLLIRERNPFEIKDSSLSHFYQLLTNYNIAFPFNVHTSIKYEGKSGAYTITSHRMFTPSQKEYTVIPVYIPAERVFFSTLSQYIFSLISNDISLPKWLLDFGAKFEKARNQIKNLDIDFLNVKYENKDGNDYINLGNEQIKLAQASSGIQSIVPLLLVIEYYTKFEDAEDHVFVIEEPEMNLYPTSQKELIEFIVQRTNTSNDKLILTTHSPYLLTTIDNLIQARNVAEIKGQYRSEIESLVPASNWIDFDNVSCYYFKDGTVVSTLDPELKSIGPSNIDDVSTELSDTFEQLLSLKYTS